MKTKILSSVVAGLLIWGSMMMVSSAHQSSHAGSVLATAEIILSLVLVIIACFLLRFP